jgi:magnesium transporter
MDARTRMLKATVSKLFRRGAEGNIRRILMRTHTADVASLLENLSTEERIAVFSHISSIDQKAEVISYLKESTQVEILSILTNPEVQEIVSRMDRDDAADLLRRLPEESSKSILNAMVKVDSEEVEELMGYPEGTAGALMSSELIALDENLTASEAIAAIQREDDDHVAFYIYVTNKRDQLVGVLSLKQLILSRPQQVLRDIMSTDVISVQLTTPHTEVAHVVEKYDFLSVPVVDQEHKLVGVITVDDVIDVIREEATEDFLLCYYL